VSFAAQTPEPAKGDRVRLSAPSVHASPLIGVLVDVTPDSVRIDPDQGRAGLAIPRRDLGRIEVSTGPQRLTFKGAGVGLAIGVGTGALMGAMMEPGIAGRSGNVFVGSILIGGIGLAIGTIVGTLHRAEGWRSAPGFDCGDCRTTAGQE